MRFQIISLISFDVPFLKIYYKLILNENLYYRSNLGNYTKFNI